MSLAVAKVRRPERRKHSGMYERSVSIEQLSLFFVIKKKKNLLKGYFQGDFLLLFRVRTWLDQVKGNVKQMLKFSLGPSARVNCMFTLQ